MGGWVGIRKEHGHAVKQNGVYVGLQCRCPYWSARNMDLDYAPLTALRRVDCMH